MLEASLIKVVVLSYGIFHDKDVLQLSINIPRRYIKVITSQQDEGSLVG